MMKQANNESGYTLIGVLAIFTIVSVFVLGLVTLSFTTLGHSKQELNNQSAFYIAEAGVNHKVSELKTLAGNLSDQSGINADNFCAKLTMQADKETTYQQFKPVNNIPPEAAVTVLDQSIEGTCSYQIISKGKIGNQVRNAEQNLTIPLNTAQGPPLNFKDYIMYAFGDMTLDYGVGFTDTVGAGGTVTVKNGVTAGGSIKEHYPLSPPRLPDFPSFPEYPAQYDNGSYNRLKQEKNITMTSDLRWTDAVFQDEAITIDTGSDDRMIFLDSLTLDNADLHIIGTGKLTIYSTGTITAKNNSKLINNNEQLTIFSTGSIGFHDSSIGNNVSQTILYAYGNLTGANAILNGSVYAKEGITLTGGSMMGNLFSKGDIAVTGLTIHGELIYSPYGHITINPTSFDIKVFGSSIYAKGVPIGHSAFGDQSMQGPLSAHALGYIPDNGHGPDVETEGGILKSGILLDPLHEINTAE